MTLDVGTVSAVRQDLILDGADIAHLSAATAFDLRRTQAAIGDAMQREIELAALATICGLDAAFNTGTIHKAPTAGKSDAGAWLGIYGLPETNAPNRRSRDPRGNRAQRRRTQALTRGRRGRGK